MAEPSTRNYGTFPFLPLPDPRRLRSYLNRLPLATRGFLVILTAFYITSKIWPGMIEWGALIPPRINLHTLYRLNTYPLLHLTIFHYLLNSIALVPLLERFELANGTIITFLLFTGPFGLLPGGLYTVVENYIIHNKDATVGASVWVFLLLASEAIALSKTDPHFQLGALRVPTWTSPLFLMLLIHFLVPGTSLLGHFSGALVGYAWGLGYIKFLAPPDAILLWIENKLGLLNRLPHFVSVDRKTFGRYGVLPSVRNQNGTVDGGVRLGGAERTLAGGLPSSSSSLSVSAPPSRPLTPVSAGETGSDASAAQSGAGFTGSGQRLGP